MTHSHDPVVNMIAGAGSGVFAVTMSYPFDLLKTRLQFEVGRGVTNMSLPEMAKIIWREGHSKGFMGVRPLGGVLGFYRGLDQLIPEAAVKVLIRFYVFTETERLYRNFILGDVTGTRSIPAGGQMLCGAIAGFVECAMVVQPFERGKTLRADFVSPYAVWGQAFKTGGFAAGMRSIYTGFVACAGRQVGNQAVAFPVFYQLKEWNKKRTGKDFDNFQRLGYGFLSGCAASAATMPLDVAKTIAQKQRGGEQKGTLAIISNVYKTSGIRGLYTGLTPRLGRVGLDRAFGFLAFEWIVEFLAKRKNS